MTVAVAVELKSGGRGSAGPRESRLWVVSRSKSKSYVASMLSLGALTLGLGCRGGKSERDQVDKRLAKLLNSNSRDLVWTIRASSSFSSEGDCSLNALDARRRTSVRRTDKRCGQTTGRTKTIIGRTFSPPNLLQLPPCSDNEIW